jgi:hypothetical protein
MGQKAMKNENREIDDGLYVLRVVESLTWREVGSRVGLSHEGARKRFHSTIGRGITEDDREFYRAEETAKRDQIEFEYAQTMRTAQAEGRTRLVLACLEGMMKCHDRRARINGLHRKIEPPVVTEEDLLVPWDEFLSQMT